MIINNINVQKLHQEFIDNNVKPYPVYVLSDTVGDFTFLGDTDMELVQQIINSHDSSPTPPTPTETELLRLEMARSNADLFETILMLTGGI